MTPGLVHVPGRDGAAWIGADRAARAALTGRRGRRGPGLACRRPA